MAGVRRPVDPPESGWIRRNRRVPAPVPELAAVDPTTPWDSLTRLSDPSHTAETSETSGTSEPSEPSSDQWSVLWSASAGGHRPAPTPTLEGDTLFSVRRGGKRPRTRRRAVLAGAGVSLAAALALIVALVGTGNPGTPASSATGSSGTVVLTSARSTLAAKTADLHLSMVMRVPGAGQVTGTGDGVVDFGTNSGQVAVQYTGLPGESGMQLMEVYVGQTLYLSTPGISEVVPGKSWISEPVSSSNSMTPGSSNPTAMFQILTDEGDTVTALGPSTIDGQAVHGYHVSIDPATIERELAHSDVPTSVVQQAESMFGGAGIEMSVFVGDDTHLLRRITFSMHLTVRSVSLSAQATEDISNYGTPVSITTPPEDQVVSLPQFVQAAASQSGETGQAIVSNS